MRFAVSLLFLCSLTFAQSPKDLLAALPLRFEQDAHQRWVTRGPGYILGFQGNQATLVAGGRAVRFTFEGASADTSMTGANALSAPANYFTPQGYRSTKMFTRLERTRLYSGIGLSYYGKAGQLEYDFNLAPGADASQIRMRFEGADSLVINEKGELVLSLGENSVSRRGSRRSTNGENPGN